MKLIPLEEFSEYISNMIIALDKLRGKTHTDTEVNTAQFFLRDIRHKANSFPTIDLSIIDEMIEEFKGDGFSYKTDLGNAYLAGLLELKSRLSLTQK